MSTHRFIRSKDKWDYTSPSTVALQTGYKVILTSRKGSRMFIHVRDESTPYHCYDKCDISRSTCYHYGFICPYYGYLKSIDTLLEDL